MRKFWDQIQDNEITRGRWFQAAPADSILMTTVNKTHFVVSSNDKTIAPILFATGSFDDDKLDIALDLLGEDFSAELLVDIGANIGSICVNTVKNGRFQRAIAIEPEPLNFRLLMANIWLNDLDQQIEAKRFALSDRAGDVLTFEISAINHGDHRVKMGRDPGSKEGSDRNVIEVPSEILDHCVSGDATAKDTLIWMDTQGYEGAVLSGATALLAKKLPIVSEFWPFGFARTGGYDAFKAALVKAQYTTIYDLNDAAPKPIAFSEDALDQIYHSLGIDELKSTDLLIC